MFTTEERYCVQQWPPHPPRPLFSPPNRMMSSVTKKCFILTCLEAFVMPITKSCEDTTNSINLPWRLFIDFNYLAIFLLCLLSNFLSKYLSHLLHGGSVPGLTNMPQRLVPFREHNEDAVASDKSVHLPTSVSSLEVAIGLFRI